MLGSDHPATLTARCNLAAEMAARGDCAAAEAEFRDVLAAKLPVLGPGRPYAQITSS